MCTCSCTIKKNNKYHSVWLQELRNSCTSVSPNGCTWEQQEWNKTKKQMKKVRRGAWVWKEAKHAWKKKESPDGLNYPNQNTIIINIICLYFLTYGKSIMKYSDWLHRQGGCLACCSCTFSSRCAGTDLFYARGTQGYCPEGFGVWPVNWIYRLWRHCP